MKLNWIIPLFAAAGLALAGCGGGGSSSTAAAPPQEQPEPTPGESQMTLIASAQEGLTTALAALDADSPTVAQMDAVDAAIALLDDALAGATDLSPNQTADARTELAAAQMTVATARTTYADAQTLEGNRTAQMDAISTAQTALATASAAVMADDAETITALNDAITALQAAIDAAADLTDAETMAAMSALMDAEVSAAQAELDMYKAAAVAEGASNEDMLAAYEGKLEAATRLVAALMANDGSATDIAEANKVIGSATATIADLEEKIQMAKDEEANKIRLANNAVSMQVAKAVVAHKVAGETRDGTNLPNAFKDHVQPDGTDGASALKISRAASGSAKITLNQSTPVAAKDKYASAAAGSVDGYAGWTYSRDSMSGKRPVTEMAGVYTDIEAAGDQAWIAFHAGTTSTGTASAENGSVALVNDAAGATPASRFSGGILPAKPTTSPTVHRIDTTTPGQEVRVSGSFYGVSGSFVCTAGTDCVVERSVTDSITVTAGTLTFEPNADTPTAVSALKAKGVVPDAAYTHFGYWMRSTSLRDDTKEHVVETFSGGTGLLSGETASDLTTGTIAAVVGTASYYGRAAGVYVKKDGAGDSLMVSHGTFTADAELNANFGGTAIAQDDQFMVRGTISDFMDGSTDLGFADLALNKAGVSQAPDAAATPAIPRAGQFSGETDGGETSGNWSGQFFGNANPTPTGGTPDLTDDYPTDVSGEFNGHFVNGHVAGAFGAERY